MTAKRGYYSLVQFSPNPARAETVNLGVVLFCPDADFLEARMAAGNRPAMKLVGRAGVDRAELNAAKQAMERRLHVDRSAFRTREDLQRFAETRANILKLTDPRPIKVVEPGTELEELFRELVGGRPRSPRERAVMPVLDDLFHRLEQTGRAQLNLDVDIPIVGRQLHVPYAYRNGVMNLVKPQVFPEPGNRAIGAAMRLAMEGDLLQKHGATEDRQVRLIVVSSFRSTSDEQEAKATVAGILHEYNVKNIPEDEVSAFVAQVEQEAH